eukprot:scaffold22489_cov62-Phaeocystis_antarctica.AAC.4
MGASCPLLAPRPPPPPPFIDRVSRCDARHESGARLCVSRRIWLALIEASAPSVPPSVPTVPPMPMPMPMVAPSPHAPPPHEAEPAAAAAAAAAASSMALRSAASVPPSVEAAHLGYTRLQPGVTCGYSLGNMWLQPLARVIACSVEAGGARGRASGARGGGGGGGGVVHGLGAAVAADLAEQLGPLGRVIAPRRVVGSEGEVGLLHLAVARSLLRLARDGGAVPRVAVALEVEEPEAAHMADALDVDREGAYELEDLRRAARQREEQEQRRGDAAEDLLQQQHELVLEEADELEVGLAHRAAAAPPLGHVVGVPRHRLQQQVGLHLQRLAWRGRGERARDGEDRREDREPPEQVVRRLGVGPAAGVPEEEDVLVEHREDEDDGGDRAEEEGDESRHHRERRVGELLDVGVGVAQAGVQPRLEGVGQLVELAHHPLGVARVVAREGGGLGAVAVDLLSVLKEEVEEHQRHDEGRQQQVQNAREHEAAAQPRDVLRALETVL